MTRWALSAEDIGDALKFVKENEMVKMCAHNGSIFAVEPPLFVELAITETEPGFKGDTATGATKPATVETGAVVQVPLFVETGDVIKIDTRTGEYLSRVKEHTESGQEPDPGQGAGSFFDGAKRMVKDGSFGYPDAFPDILPDAQPGGRRRKNLADDHSPEVGARRPTIGIPR